MSKMQRSGTAYTVVGAAECPHFAKCQRVAEVLQAYLPASHLQVEMKHPIEWSEFLETLRMEKGFLDFTPSEEQRVLVYCHLTNRLVGTADDFINEALEKYGVRCDISWAHLKACGEENMNLYNTTTSYKDEREQRRKDLKLALVVVGPVASGKATQCALIKEKYGVEHITVEGLITQNINDRTDLGRQAKRFRSFGDEVPEDVVLGMLVAKMKSPEVTATGWVLEGHPWTDKQAWGLYDAGFDPHAVVQLDASEEVTRTRIAALRIDPATGLKTVPSIIPGVSDHLVNRPEDAKGPLERRLRAYRAAVPALSNVYKETAYLVNADAEPEKVFTDISMIIGFALDRVEQALL